MGVPRGADGTCEATDDRRLDHMEAAPERRRFANNPRRECGYGALRGLSFSRAEAHSVWGEVPQ